MGYKEIVNMIVKNVESGKIIKGEKLPSIRELASELGVAKKTVESAYEVLASEGFIISEGRRGTFVSLTLPLPKATNKAFDKKIKSTEMLKSKIDPIFRLGIPALDAFPENEW